ncbi:hypothetical protein JCGZ_17899 [Jatropha curcas]|uniref:Uncharacterized protein n=2 Tax=Jatropha curcas TaxID=180498 RepID=A0A067JS33_JATCU|nr:hypothetical protein JCGZ_17899 [Jatropha curcas]
MKLECELISKEIIKPSSPTPDHLRHYKLSFLDQISPPVYNPLLLFYETDGETKFNSVEKYNQLKQSLSQALIHFYPLAGRIKDNHFVDCNDEGIPCLQAKVSGKLSDVVQSPVPTEIKKLLPFELDQDQELPLGVQFNIFECGGICIGLCLSHNIGDALSIVLFVKIWAAITRGEEEITRPEFVSAKLFPPKDFSGFNPRIGFAKENVLTERFVFKSSSIESLRAKYAASTSLKSQRPPSRVEALSAFIWTRFMAAIKQQTEEPSEKIYMMLHAVNLRTRMNPPLPENSFGNFYRVAMTFPSPTNNGEESNYDDIVIQMRDSISKIDTEYVKKLQEAGNDEHMDFIKQMAQFFMRGEMVSLNFTSLCRFPLYETDFGWRKPIWVGSPSLTFKNLVVFMDTPSGDGIEALIHLNQEDMQKFKEDQELLQFVSC